MEAHDFDGMILPSIEPDPVWDGLVQPAPEPRRRGGAAVWAGMLGLVGSVVFAFFFLAGNSADTPEQAVERLFEAIANEDALGMLEALPPSERDPMKGRATGVVAELKRLEILSGDADPARIAGLDLAFNDVELTATSLGDGVSAVRIDGGTAHWSVTPSELPLGRLVREFLGDELPTQTVSDDEPLTSDGLEQLVAVEEGGRWYVSVFYTAAEAIRAQTGAPAPSFGQGLKARGEPSPEAAVRALADAGTRFDLRRALELLPPDEGRVVHDYAPLFLDSVERMAAEELRESSATLTDLRLAAERDGKEARVRVEEFGMAGVADGEQFAVRFDGQCISILDDGETERMCPEQATALTGMRMGMFGWGSMTIVTVERDGLWYVSPTRTVLDGALEALRRTNLYDVEKFASGDWSGLVGDGRFDLSGDDDEESGEYWSEEEDGGYGTVPEEEEELPVAPEPTMGGYTFEEFLQLPPEEQARVLREVQEDARRRQEQQQKQQPVRG